MSGKKIGYRRVSSIDQNLDRQLDGLELDKMFEDKISGVTENREGLDALIDYVRDGDIVYIHSIDRLSRDMLTLLTITNKILAKGATLRFVENNIIFDAKEENPQTKFIFNAMGSTAELERSLLKIRQKQGIAIAKSKGVKFGRKSKFTPAKEKAIVKEYINRPNDRGSVLELLRKHSISDTFLRNLIKKYPRN